MARVDFYILPDENPPEKFACVISGKLIREGHRIHLHAADRDSAAALDDLLWTYRDISFIPHKLVDDKSMTEPPLTIGWDGSSYTKDSVLINLDVKIPDIAPAFARIIEIVASHDPQRSQARDRYRQYRDQGYELHNHEIDARYADA